MKKAVKGSTESTMATSHELAVHEKRELETKEEKTVPGRYYIPDTDVYETNEALIVVMEVPGVERQGLDVALENDVLRVEGKIDSSKYKGLEPVYTEYSVGNFARSFSLSSKVDQVHISAQFEDGVLTLTLPKVAEARPRRIALK